MITSPPSAATARIGVTSGRASRHPKVAVRFGARAIATRERQAGHYRARNNVRGHPFTAQRRPLIGAFRGKRWGFLGYLGPLEGGVRRRPLRGCAAPISGMRARSKWAVNF